MNYLTKDFMTSVYITHMFAIKHLVEIAKIMKLGIDTPLLLLGTGTTILLETYFIGGFKPKEIYIVDPATMEDYITENITEINNEPRFLDKMGLTKDEWKDLKIRLSNNPKEQRVPKHLLSIAIHPGFSMSPAHHSDVAGEDINITWDTTIETVRPSIIIFTSFSRPEFEDDCEFLQLHKYSTSFLRNTNNEFFIGKRSGYGRIFGVAIDLEYLQNRKDS